MNRLLTKKKLSEIVTLFYRSDFSPKIILYLNQSLGKNYSECKNVKPHFIELEKNSSECCSNPRIVKNGKYRGKQRFKCANCSVTASSYIEKPMKKMATTIRFIGKGKSIKETAQYLKVSSRTISKLRSEFIQVFKNNDIVRISKIERISHKWDDYVIGLSCEVCIPKKDFTEEIKKYTLAPTKNKNDGS